MSRRTNFFPYLASMMTFTITGTVALNPASVAFKFLNGDANQISFPTTHLRQLLLFCFPTQAGSPQSIPLFTLNDG